MPKKTFLERLYDFIEVGEYSEYIAWTPQGNSFQIQNPTEFYNAFLSIYFKEIPSYVEFVSILFQHGFVKIAITSKVNFNKEQKDPLTTSSSSSSGIFQKKPAQIQNRTSAEIHEFQHPLFIRKRRDFLKAIEMVGESKRERMDSGPKRTSVGRRRCNSVAPEFGTVKRRESVVGAVVTGIQLPISAKLDEVKSGDDLNVHDKREKTIFNKYFPVESTKD